MQDGFIEFIDIKLQRAEETRQKVKGYLDRSYDRMMECASLSELDIRQDILRDAVYSAGFFGLISKDVEKSLLKKLAAGFMARRAELRKENM